MKRNLPAIPPGAKPPAVHGRGTVRNLQRATHIVDALANRIIPYDASNQASPDQRARPTILVGITLIFVLFGIIGTWAALVPLATGAVAPGRIVVDTSRKDIQHLEGGIVSAVLVKDGDEVTAGQLLVRLDSTSATAKNDQLQNQYFIAKANEARLIAERDGKDAVSFPEELTSKETTNPKAHEAMETQRNLFKTQRDTLSGQISVLNQKIAQSQEEIHGLREQSTAATRQIALLDEEITVVKGLLASGNALKSRLLALQRQQADMMGQRGNADAMVSRAYQTINESKIDILNQRTQFLNAAVSELKDTQSQLSSLSEQMRSSADVVKRIDITAPQAGTITDLKVHTIGGVVQPGETLMSLIPANDKLIVEVHVLPTDIDVVHTGLDAQVRLTAFKTRYMVPLKGTVVNVGADRVDDPHTSESYFLARIKIPQSELAARGNLKLSQGMPAEALIVTGKRTMLSYIVGPIRASFGHAFREQ